MYIHVDSCVARFGHLEHACVVVSVPILMRIVYMYVTVCTVNVVQTRSFYVCVTCLFTHNCLYSSSNVCSAK